MDSSFEITDWKATPQVNRRHEYDDGEWTWNESGRSRYRAGDVMEVVYTVRVDSNAEAGDYRIDGEAVFHGPGLERAIAGTQTITVTD